MELCNLARDQGRVNMVGYNRRFTVTFRKAKEILDEGTLGELVFFEGYAYSSDLLEVEVNSKSLPRDGVLRDLGCHVIDLAFWFFGELKVEIAEIKSIISEGSEDFVYLRIKTLEGLEGEIKSSWCMKNYRLPEIGLIIRGSKGIMKVNDDKLELKLSNDKTVTWYRHDLGDNVPFLLGGAEYFREDEAFIRAILEGHNVEPSFQTALKVEQVIAQVKETARKK
ncbi:hypothetical protein DRO69_06115 [Candidatus Bathyarchaeota archaeon]|nr:MAG: hypothetical protein DRO69_06115 [Candidatus Bathyarchaeota archaeon]